MDVLVHSFRRTTVKSLCKAYPKVSPICKRCLFTAHLESLKRDRKLFAQQLPDPVTPDLEADLNGSNDWSTYLGIDPTGR